MYKIYLDVSDSSGKTVTFVTDYEIVTTKVVINPSNTGIAGKAVTISIEGISHNKDLRYKYVWMKDNWSEWNVIRDFSESQMIKWTPEKKGEYSLYVDIMNIKTNKVVTHTVRYTVN